MNREVWSVILLLMTSVSTCPEGTSGNSQGNCVHVESTRMDWHAAEDFCVNKGGHLVSIHNAFDASLLTQLAGSTNCKYYWAGGVCSGGKCTWTDGTPFNYYNWDKGYPSQNNYVSIGFYSGGWRTETGTDGECFACETKPGAVRTDCLDWQKAGYTDNGMYEIQVNNIATSVYCDMTTEGGGWTVIQSRVDGTEAFWNRSWADFKSGFGTPGQDSNYWAGNELIHQLTAKNNNVSLKIEMHNDGTPGSNYSTTYWWNNYFSFMVADEANLYKLNIAPLPWDNVQGNASTGWYDITYSSGSPFSTIDKINDPQKDCVTKYQMGGWWLYNCALSSLNGAYTPVDWNEGYGLFWIVDGMDEIIHPRKTTMKIRAVS